jgi:hypothetical protein
MLDGKMPCNYSFVWKKSDSSVPCVYLRNRKLNYHIPPGCIKIAFVRPAPENPANVFTSLKYFISSS